jgi:hypothetical protein
MEFPAESQTGQAMFELLQEQENLQLRSSSLEGRSGQSQCHIGAGISKAEL